MNTAFCHRYCAIRIWQENLVTNGDNMQALILKGKSMVTYRNVKAQIAKLEKQAADLYKKEVAGVAAKVRALVEEYGLTAEDLGFTGKPAKAARKARQAKAVTKTAGVPKYRDPESGKTWTGHGKAPGWIYEAVKQGRSKDDFLIGKKAPRGKATAAKTEKSVVSAKVPKVATFKSGKLLKVKPPKATKAQAHTKKAVVKKTAVVAKPAKAKTAKAPVRKSTTKKLPVAATVVPATTGEASA